jgi:hypothetical protein
MDTVRTLALWKILLLLVAATVLAACDDDSSTASSTVGSNTPGSATTTTTGGGSSTDAAPTISGSAATTVVAGQTYSFQPSTTDPGGSTLSFSITNKPAWASFNTTTGLLLGTPTAAEAATYSNITISVSAGQSSATLPPFAIVVTAAAMAGSATLSWDAPVENTNGSPLNDLAGYTIYYGTNSADLTQTIKITDPTETTYVVDNLSAGTYYFSVAADASDGTQSSLSALGSKTIM